MHKAYKTSALPVGPEKTSVLPVAVRPWKKVPSQQFLLTQLIKIN
jgi:hypothetical protein